MGQQKDFSKYEKKYRYQRNGLNQLRLGQMAWEAAHSGVSQTIAETTDAMGQSYIKELFECADEGKKKFADPFYLVALRRKEKISNMIDNVINCRYLSRQTKPELGFMVANFGRWDYEVYEASSSLGEIKLLYALPEQNMWPQILKHPEDFPSETVEWIKMAKAILEIKN